MKQALTPNKQPLIQLSFENWQWLREKSFYENRTMKSILDEIIKTARREEETQVAPCLQPQS